MPSAECALRLERTVNSVQKKASSLGIVKTKESISQVMKERMKTNMGVRKNWFKKGHDAYMKGKRLDDVLSPEAVKKFRSHTWTKDNYIDHSVPVGTESERKGYILVKQADGKWQYKQRVVWESTFGSIPEGHIVRFRNGNSLDCRPENLLLQSRQDHIAEIRAMYPEEMKIAWARLRTLDNLIKKLNGER